jgi:peroxin-19
VSTDQKLYTSSKNPQNFGPSPPFLPNKFKEINDAREHGREHDVCPTTQESELEVEKAVADMMHQMQHLFPCEDFGKEGNTHVNVTPEKGKETSAKGSMEDNRQSSDEMKDMFSNLLRGLSNNEELDEDMFHKFGGEMSDEMQRDWEETMKKANLGTFGNRDEDAMGHVVDGMMKQLLSKEFMYEPMKDITDKFPKWLADNKAKLSVEEYEK